MPVGVKRVSVSPIPRVVWCRFKNRISHTARKIGVRESTMQCIGNFVLGKCNCNSPSRPSIPNDLFAERMPSKSTSMYGHRKWTSAYLFPNRPLIIHGANHFLSPLFSYLSLKKKTVSPNKKASFCRTNPLMQLYVQFIAEVRI